MGKEKIQRFVFDGAVSFEKEVAKNQAIKTNGKNCTSEW